MPSKAAVLTTVCSLNVAVIIGVMWFVQYLVDRGHSLSGDDDDDNGNDQQGVGPWWKYVMLVFVPPVLMTPTIAYSFYVMGFMHRGCCKKSVQDGGEMDVPEMGLLERNHGIQAMRGQIGLVVAGSFFSGHSNPLVPLDCNDRPPAYGEVVMAPGALGLGQDHGHGLGCGQCGRRPATPQDGTSSTTATLQPSGYATTCSSSTNNCSCSIASNYNAPEGNQLSGSLEEKPPDYNTAVLMKGC